MGKSLRDLAKDHSDHSINHSIVDDFEYSMNVMFNDRGLSGPLGEYALPGPLKYGTISEVLSHAGKVEKDLGIKNTLFKAADGGSEVSVYGQHDGKYWCFIPLSGDHEITDYFIEYTGKKRIAFLLIG